MTSTLDKIIESKRALRRELARRPIAEKLRLLETMRERLTRRSEPDADKRRA